MTLYLFVGVDNRGLEFSTRLQLSAARFSLLSDIMCSLLLLLLTGNVGGAEEEAVYDDEDECILNIGDGELVLAAEYIDARLNDVGERRSNVGEEGGILVAPDDDDDDD